MKNNRKRKSLRVVGIEATSLPTDSAPRISKLTAFLANSRTLLFNVTLLLMSGALLWILYKEVRLTSISVRPIPVPEALSKRGYTPDVVAARVMAELRRIGSEANTNMPLQQIIEDEKQIEF